MRGVLLFAALLPCFSAYGAGKVWEIAVVPKDATIGWFKRMDVGVTQFAKDTGMKAYMKGPSKTDAAMQAEVIEDLISAGVDALCVVPIDPVALEPVLEKAMKKGIVVVTHEGASQQNTMYDIEAFDNNEYGAFIMDNLAKAMNYSGKYVTMVGFLTNASHNEWADGGIARQKEKYPKMQLIEADARVEIHDDPNVTYEKAKELFKKYPDLKGIFGTSGHAAPNSAKAIEELGLKGKAFTCGTGLPSQVKRYLKDGTMQYATLWDPADAGYAMAVLAKKILDKEPVATGVNLGRKGYEKMNLKGKLLIGAGWITLTKDNVDQFDF
ncbi:MAG TPA: autoinducer 2 ABC transporter substrate-binding protein [Anaeromyxobacteraceae bacterium]|nr:autoinducer 2 ABC transporter substrate-binding protein [Anaeromyxobacteraceae bacterium]